MLLTGHELIQRIREYEGGGDEIRTAISQPTAENEEAAWRKICPSAALLRQCYDYAQSIDRIIPSILEELCGQVNDHDLGRTDRNRGLARLLADLMQNAFTFDALKATIQNDLSYYRRTQARMPKSQDEKIARGVIPQDVSNHMSLFYAYHNPMVKAVVDSASQFAKETRTEALVLNALSTLAAGSFNTLKQSKADSAESEQLSVFVLVTCCVLYDWISESGISSSQSTIDIRAVAATVSGCVLVENTTADSVLRANCRTYR
ncbi:hypothetical protein GGI15_003911 [Coemansia interrupta]|uniref:CYRIA/CYRIB Rac1 binding domain-containing protein n=1 Tax=Coemansia interrupta TaxID=1126814 RepID=A0A9W8LGR2_9FUNG|nr:hypothetical protein GGI15_003911 [Coemansia interrupta]